MIQSLSPFIPGHIITPFFRVIHYGMPAQTQGNGEKGKPYLRI
jgi:hypothetical protein